MSLLPEFRDKNFVEARSRELSGNRLGSALPRTRTHRKRSHGACRLHRCHCFTRSRRWEYTLRWMTSAPATPASATFGSFPLMSLKIDQSFVQPIIAISDDATIVGAAIGLGKNLKQCVIAEGVETREQLAFLQNPALRGRTRQPLQPPIGCGRVRQFASDRPAKGASVHSGTPCVRGCLNKLAGVEPLLAARSLLTSTKGTVIVKILSLY